MMKKYIKTSIIIVIIIVTSISVYFPKKDNIKMSSLAIENIEALASGEIGDVECIAPYTYTCVFVGNIGYKGIKISF